MSSETQTERGFPTVLLSRSTLVVGDFPSFLFNFSRIKIKQLSCVQIKKVQNYMMKFCKLGPYNVI